jgi:hypothetical protein
VSKAAEPAAERAARNEALFREVNERIKDVDETSDLGLFEFVCECADLSCAQQITMTLGEYESVRSQPDQFLVRKDHAVGDVEVVVEERPNYRVVAKIGAAGDSAAELDPRT